MPKSLSGQTTPVNKALFQKLRQAALESPIEDGEELQRVQQVHESMKNWENAKETLTEIQGLLSQAYHEIELMGIEN